MPFQLFNFEDTIEPVGLSPDYSSMEVLCKNGTWDPVAGIVAPCRNKGGEATPRKYRPMNPPKPPPPPKCAPTMKSGNCNYRLV